MALVEMNADMKILIIDENATGAEAMKLFLKRVGYRNFVHEPSAYDGFRRIRGGDLGFVLCRLNLPFVNGLSLFEEIKADLGIPRLPFALFDENLTPADTALFEEYGVDGHLQLPFAARDLAQLLASTWARYIDQSNPEYHFELARRRYVAQEHQAAKELFLELLKGGKLTARCLVALGRIARRTGAMSEALRYAQRAATEFPSYVHAHQLLGETLLEDGQPMEAVEALLRGIELSPKNPLRYEIVGDTLGNLGLWAEAENIYRRAQAAGLRQSVLTAGLAASLANQGKRGEAIGLYRLLLQSEPKNVGYLNNLAACCKGEGDAKAAASHYRKALEIDPRSTKVLYNLALLEHEAGRKVEAMALLEQALSIDAGYEKARRKLAEWKGFTREKGENDETCSAPSVSSDIQACIQALLARFEKENNQQTGRLPRIPLPEAEAGRIAALSEDEAHRIFSTGALALRKPFLDVLESWRVSVSTTSEEIVGTISEVVFNISNLSSQEGGRVQNLIHERSRKGSDLENAVTEALASRDQVYQNAIYGIIQELQFQDLLSQTLQGIVAAECIAFGAAESAQVVPTILPKLPNEEQRNRFRGLYLEVTHGQGSYLGTLATVERFALETLEGLATGVSESCKRITSPIDSMEASRGPAWQEARKLLVLSLDQRRNDGLNGLAELLEAENETQKGLAALVGIARFYLLLSGRISSLAEMMRIVAGLNPLQRSPSDARVALDQYGMDLRLVWKHCEAVCRTVAEQTLLKSVLGGRA